MISPFELNALLRRRPFIPLRLHLSDNSTYDVTHPEWVAVGNTVAFVGARRDPNSPIFDEPVLIALGHITRIEPLVPVAAQ